MPPKKTETTTETETDVKETQKVKTLGVILAGGQSRRFGGFKALHSWQGKPLISHVHDTLNPTVEQVVVAAGPWSDRFEGLGNLCLDDGQFPDHGPIAGILSALSWAEQKGTFTQILSLPCDSPRLPNRLLPALLDVGPADQAAFIRLNGRDHYTHALWRPACIPLLEDLLLQGQRRMTEAHKVCQSLVVDLGLCADAVRLNVNTPEDLTDIT